ncbi:MFS general substrate transporter [Ramaria rubella]|nr:MFS general substrate transporter [Ramaria rubella]
MPSNADTTTPADDDTLYKDTQVWETGSKDEKVDQKLVTLGDDDPKKLPLARKWLIVLIISSATLCATCGSTVAGSTEAAIQREFNVPHEVAILGISLNLLGLGFGPLILGPLSEFYGRNWIYWISFSLYFLLGFPVAFANHIAIYLVFRFLNGLAGSAFLSVAGGSVSDLFDNASVATPMAVYTTSPFLGPAVGPAFAGFVHANWRWTYYVILMWSFCEVLALVLFVPETYTPTILQRKARRLRKVTGDDEIYAPLDRNTKGVFQTIAFSCCRPFEIMVHEQMALLLNLWSAVLLGILYLSFQSFPIIFGKVHHFNVQMTGLSFIGIGIGELIALLSQVIFWNNLFQKQVIKYKGHPPPEVRLYMGMAGAILVPVSLFWLAFTTYPHVHWAVPLITSIPLGAGILFSFASIYTFLVTAYRPNAASAMAGNSFVRSSFAAVFPLFAGAMYDRLGTVGATALLAGLITLLAPLPFVFFKYGARIRKNSRFTEVE